MRAAAPKSRSGRRSTWSIWLLALAALGLVGCRASAAGMSRTYLPLSVGGQSGGGGPQILNLGAPLGSPVRYGRLEWAFDLSKSYPNPYYSYDPDDRPAGNPPGTSWAGVDGVSVDMQLTAPSGATLSVPAFWSEAYLRVQSEGIEVLGRADGGRWRVRFTPTEAGDYSYYLTARDASGTTRYPAAGALAFTAAGASGRGFVRASPADPRFLAYESGEPFRPIAAGHQWWQSQSLRSFELERVLADDGANGVNLVRLWDQADFALGVEGAQPVWLQEGTTWGAARGVAVATADVRTGLRAAAPTPGSGWYQRIALAEPDQPHRLAAWIRTSGGQASLTVTAGAAFRAGPTLAAAAPVGGATGWTRYEATFVPRTTVVSLNLAGSGPDGSVLVDDVELGPLDPAGELRYNAVSDPGFERHFAKDIPGDDPNATPSLPRPLGNYVNQWAAAELDAIVGAAERGGVALQLCSCSGPWFTWPKNPSEAVDADWGETWMLRSWQRNFRYRVARWGYSPAVLAWELFNEHGHVPVGSKLYDFYQAYGAYQQATDPYRHLRTTSQGSQAFSPAFWSSGAFDLANYHDYLMPSRYPASLVDDEANFVYRYGWCLRSQGSYCAGLAGDGSAWRGPPLPWVWGEIGVGTTVWNQPELAGTRGEGGRRALHNQLWAGLLSPLGTAPIDWYWQSEDAPVSTAKLAERKAAAAFFADVDLAGGQLVHLMTAADAPSGYAGETIAASDGRARVYAVRRADRAAAYLWVQNRAHTWRGAASTPAPLAATVTIGGLLDRAYTVELWSTYAGAPLSSLRATPVGGSLTIPIVGLSDDLAVKVTAA